MTYNTGNPLGSTDPRDLFDNAENLDEVLNSGAFSWTDRFGQSKTTMTGAIYTIKSFIDRGAWAPSTTYAVKDLVSNSGTWYVCVVPHTSSAAFVTDSSSKWRVYQGVTSGDLAAREALKKTVNILDFANLRDAIAALPADGGIVDIPVGRFFAGEWNYNTQYMDKPNVTLRGAKMPTFSANCDRLEGGSIIEGRFNVFADNFHHENIGYDLGKYVCDTRFAGYDSHSSNYPLAGGTSTWDAFAFAQPNMVSPLSPRRGFSAKNVVGLLRDSQSYGHAVLQEGFNGGTIDNVVGMYGIHANVIKAHNVSCGFIAGYGASTDHVILKSDSYAAGYNIKIDTVETGVAPPGTSPWVAPAYCTFGLFLNPASANMNTIKIGKARLYGASNLLAASGANLLDNLMIDELEIEGFGLSNPIGINFNTSAFYRINFGKVTINNVADGIAYSNSHSAWASNPMHIQSLSFADVSLRCLQALGYGVFLIDQLRTDAVIGTLYSIDPNARVYVGVESLVGTPATKFGNSPPTLNAAWEQYPGQGAFRVHLENYGVRLSGLIRPIGGGSGSLFTLPSYLRSGASTHSPAIADGTGGQVCRQIESSPSLSSAIINSGVNANGAENWISLDNVFWKLN